MLNQLVGVTARSAKGDTLALRFQYPSYGEIVVKSETRALTAVEYAVALRWATHWPKLFDQLHVFSQLTNGFERIL